MNTDCSKCKGPMSAPPPRAGARFLVTAYRCDCGHWNDLKRRKGYAEWHAANRPETIKLSAAIPEVKLTATVSR